MLTGSTASFLAPPSLDPIEPWKVPTFSVIIAAYQAAGTIAETVASALDQTLPPLEVIVCDDGSTDDLGAALAPFGDRITLLRKENGGAASARNHALRAASGDFVAPLDSDDLFLPRRLEALGKLAAARPDLDLLSTDVQFEASGAIVGRFYAANRFELVDQRTAIFTWCFVGWPAARRERLLAVGGFDESLVTADDWDAWIRLILHGARAGLVPEALLRYRLRPGSLSSDRTRVLRERVVLLDKTAANPDLRAEERPALARARRTASGRACLAEAREALLQKRADSRRRALRLALAPDVGLRTRALGAGAALLPRLAARVLARASGSASLHERHPPRHRA
jgi:GT2 family glycosyltransferase